MNLKEKLSYFWNVTLGEDYPETEDVEKSNNPEFAELKKSLNRIEEMENTYSKPASSSKGGKGNSGKTKIVETVAIDPKAVKAMANKAQEKQETVTEQSKEER